MLTDKAKHYFEQNLTDRVIMCFMVRKMMEETMYNQGSNASLIDCMLLYFKNDPTCIGYIPFLGKCDRSALLTFPILLSVTCKLSKNFMHSFLT